MKHPDQKPLIKTKNKNVEESQKGALKISKCIFLSLTVDNIAIRGQGFFLEIRETM